MEPFRALVADKLPESQRSYGFVVQTLIIGIGTWIASNLPWLMTQLGAANNAPEGIIPDSVKYAFAIGAFVLFSSILYTILTTDEYPPEDLEAFEKEKYQKNGFFGGFKEVLQMIVNMPTVMKQLGLVQFFSWFAFFTMWSFATPAITEHIFGATDPSSDAYNDAANLVGNYMGTYGLVSMFFALLLSFVTAKVKINRKLLHLVSLVTGGIGFILIYFISDPWILHLTLPNKEIDYVLIYFSPKPWMLHICFALVGIAWASILSMPYAMLSGSVEPQKMGTYMGIFNMFIVIPQIVAALGGVNFLYKLLFGEEVIYTMTLAGTLLILAGLANLLITDKRATHD
jgi:maltose/moltooligosaccharide transporter